MLLTSFAFSAITCEVVSGNKWQRPSDGKWFLLTSGSNSSSRQYNPNYFPIAYNQCSNFSWGALDNKLGGSPFFVVKNVNNSSFSAEFFQGNKVGIGRYDGHDEGYMTSAWNVIFSETTPPEPELPQCGEGTYLNPATLSCVPFYPIADEETLESGSKNIIFEDGAMMIVNPDGTAVTFAPDGAKIPNRLYNGSIPEVGYLSESKNIAVGGSDFFTVNPLGIFLKSTAVGIITNFGALAWTNLIISDQKKTANGDVVDFKRTQNGVAVNISQKAFDNIDFSEYENKATTTPQSVPNTDVAYKKLSDAEILQFLGATKNDTVFYKPNDPSYFVASNADSVAVVKSNPDGSAQKLEIQKNDLQNTATNNTNLQVTQTTISAPKINNDGTTSTTTNTSVGSVSTATNTNTTTSSNGSTSTVNPTAGTSTNGAITPSSDGTGSNINLSGVTSRLDKISNQITKQNERNDEIDKSVVAAVPHGIPLNPPDWDTWLTTWNNLTADLDNVVTKTYELKSLIEGEPLALNLARGGVESCPYNGTIELKQGWNIPVSYDYCKVLAPVRPVTYTMFYFVFVGATLFFSLKILFRLV